MRFSMGRRTSDSSSMVPRRTAALARGFGVAGLPRPAFGERVERFIGFPPRRSISQRPQSGCPTFGSRRRSPPTSAHYAEAPAAEPRPPARHRPPRRRWRRRSSASRTAPRRARPRRCSRSIPGARQSHRGAAAPPAARHARPKSSFLLRAHRGTYVAMLHRPRVTTVTFGAPECTGADGGGR